MSGPRGRLLIGRLDEAANEPGDVTVGRLRTRPSPRLEYN